jgi:hypothetical protein
MIQIFHQPNLSQLQEFGLRSRAYNRNPAAPDDTLLDIDRHAFQRSHRGKQQRVCRKGIAVSEKRGFTAVAPCPMRSEGEFISAGLGGARSEVADPAGPLSLRSVRNSNQSRCREPITVKVGSRSTQMKLPNYPDSLSGKQPPRDGLQ